MYIAPDKALFSAEEVRIVFLFLHKTCIVVLVRSASLRVNIMGAEIYYAESLYI